MNKYELWYRRPARAWEEALPIGNGRIGAMVFGGAEEERLALNEDTLWSGYPKDKNNPEAKEHLKSVRDKIKAGEIAAAEEETNRFLLGQWTESYLPLGDLLLEMHGAGEISDYRRSLDIRTGLSRTEFVQGGIRFVRTAFVSHPAQALVVRVEAAYCVDVTCTVQSTLQSATQTCEGQTAVVVLSGLQLGTEYQVAVSSQAAELSEVLAIATAAEQENVVELAEARVFAHSAAVEVTLSVPDRVYCTAHTQPVHAEALLEKLAGGMLSDLLVPQAPATTATVVLTDLAATTAYSVTCVTVLSHTVVSKPAFFTTVAEEAPLTVVAVSAAGDRRD